MSSRKVRAKRRHICEQCGNTIGRGEPCYRIDDDFMDGLVTYEHICCERQLSQAANRRKARDAWDRGCVGTREE